MRIGKFVPLGAVLLLPVAFGALAPSHGDPHAAAVNMQLPREIDGWQSEAEEPSKEELSWLAEDTSFEKRRYWAGSREGIGQLREVQAGIILSGADVNDSIHRPERCLRAQGFQKLKPSNREIDLGGGAVLRVKRLRSFRRLSAQDGTSYDVANLNYYWFVGSEFVTNDHYARTFRDMRDRLIGGYSQRWAYFTISTNITDNLPDGSPRSEAEADRILREFARRVYRDCVRIEAGDRPAE